MQPLGSHQALKVVDGDPAAGCDSFMRQINLMQSHLSASVLYNSFRKVKVQKEHLQSSPLLSTNICSSRDYNVP